MSHIKMLHNNSVSNHPSLEGRGRGEGEKKQGLICTPIPLPKNGERGLFQQPAKYRAALNNRRGATLIMAMLILAVISLLAIISANKAIMEQRISTNMKKNAATFYMAESGLNHAQRILMNLFQADEANQQLIASDPDNQPVWTFILNGSLALYNTPYYYYCQGCETGDSVIDGSWVSMGVQILSRTVTLDGLTYTYTTTIWNNNDGATGVACGGSATLDCDGLIMLRSVAQAFAPGSADPISESVLETVLAGDIESLGAILPGLAQDFANEGKTSSGGDINEISDFTKTSIL